MVTCTEHNYEGKKKNGLTVAEDAAADLAAKTHVKKKRSRNRENVATK